MTPSSPVARRLADFATSSPYTSSSDSINYEIEDIDELIDNEAYIKVPSFSFYSFGALFLYCGLKEKYGSVWNYKFQRLLSEVRGDSSKWIEIQNLTEDFVNNAETFGRIIISEFDPTIFSLKCVSSSFDLFASLYNIFLL